MKFLVFQHVAHEPPGMLVDAAAKWGVSLEVIEFWRPYKIPSAKGFDALMIMGGPMGVYEGKEQYPSKEEELAFIKANIGELPMIGFCLGAQLIAYALGARVYPNLTAGKRVKEVGYCKVELTEEGNRDHLFDGFKSPITVLQLHGDVFDLPQDAVLLARSSLCENQAFRWGDRTYSTLFHNEYTSEMVEQQIEVGQAWMHKDFDIDIEQLRRESKANAPMMRAQCEQLFENFYQIVLETR